MFEFEKIVTRTKRQTTIINLTKKSITKIKKDYEKKKQTTKQAKTKISWQKLNI